MEIIGAEWTPPCPLRYGQLVGVPFSFLFFFRLLFILDWGCVVICYLGPWEVEESVEHSGHNRKERGGYRNEQQHGRMKKKRKEIVLKFFFFLVD